MRSAAKIGKIFLEFRHTLSRSQYAGFQHSSNSRDLILTNGRSRNRYLHYYSPFISSLL
jgi:hypothetical protein